MAAPVLNLLQRAPYAPWVGAPEDLQAAGPPLWPLTPAERQREARDKARHRLREELGGDMAAQLAEVRDYAARCSVHGHMPDAELRAIAARRAEWMRERMAWADEGADPADVLLWLNLQLELLQARPFALACTPTPAQLEGLLRRARCPLWWRRQLRRAAVRDRETTARKAGEVSAARRQPYVTTDTAKRHAARQRDTAAMMAGTELENDQGQVMTLAELAEKSPSNKAIRRGELMTRISGCERWAEANGHRGVFLTLTAPSRFHRVHRHGAANAKHDGSTPRDAQAWLSAAWARARAKLQRVGVALYGFRVAEPHHDGTPHWHALLWALPGQLWRAVRVVKRAWLKLEGDERGAREHRCKAVLMHAGGASGYIAKYVAKNIDDAGAVADEGHRDEGLQGQGVPEPAKADRFGGTAQRVEAWASAWGIRQFQAIGQPPVTVWRELRRIKEHGGASPRMAAALDAVNREGGRRASWAGYVLAQGGMATGRAYLLKLARVLRMKHGLYESSEALCVVGVIDTTGPGDVQVSNRRDWKPRGTWTQQERGAGGIWAPRAAPPWTRVINCTRRIAHRLAETAPPDPAELERRRVEEETPRWEPPEPAYRQRLRENRDRLRQLRTA